MFSILVLKCNFISRWGAPECTIHFSLDSSFVKPEARVLCRGRSTVCIQAHSVHNFISGPCKITGKRHFNSTLPTMFALKQFQFERGALCEMSNYILWTGNRTGEEKNEWLGSKYSSKLFICQTITVVDSGFRVKVKVRAPTLKV